MQSPGFVAVDVETANHDTSSICQVGVAACDARGRVRVVLDRLVDPEAAFDPGNVQVHGITAKDVKRAGAFPQAAEQLRRLLTNQIVISHTDFDRKAIDGAFRRYRLPPLQCTWLDSRDIARRTWSLENYKLPTIAKHLGIRHRHHNAADDARVCAEIVARALREKGTTIDQWAHGTPAAPAQATKRRGCLARMLGWGGVLAVLLATYHLKGPRL